MSVIILIEPNLTLRSTTKLSYSTHIYCEHISIHTVFNFFLTYCIYYLSISAFPLFFPEDLAINSNLNILDTFLHLFNDTCVFVNFYDQILYCLFEFLMEKFTFSRSNYSCLSMDFLNFSAFLMKSTTSRVVSNCPPVDLKYWEGMTTYQFL